MIDSHDFQSAESGDRLGTELDHQAGYSPFEAFSVNLKIAHYMADTWLTDVTKVMMWASWSFDTTF